MISSVHVNHQWATAALEYAHWQLRAQLGGNESWSFTGYAKWMQYSFVLKKQKQKYYDTRSGWQQEQDKRASEV